MRVLVDACVHQAAIRWEVLSVSWCACPSSNDPVRGVERWLVRVAIGQQPGERSLALADACTHRVLSVHWFIEKSAGLCRQRSGGRC